VAIDVDNELKEDIYELDEVVGIENNGIYVVSSNGGDKIRIRDLVMYCKENNKESSQLSQGEIEKFYK
jgi:orotate phosphoribosyltransferase-like protein